MPHLFRLLLRFAILSMLALALTGAAAARAAEPPPVPPEVVQGAGLDKLSEAERETLYRWIRERVPQSAPAVAPAVPTSTATTVAPVVAAPAAAATVVAAAPVAAPPQPGPLDWGPDVNIETRIVSKFDGWTGRTFFEMENGQIWQQRMDGRYQYRGSDTRVNIKRGMFGMHRMTLVDTGRWIGVKQVR